MENNLFLSQVCNLGVLQSLSPILNRLWYLDDDLISLLNVHPTWAHSLLDSGLRVPVFERYLTSLKTGNITLFNQLKNEGRKQLEKILALRIFESLGSQRVWSFEQMIALLNGNPDFIMQVAKDENRKLAGQAPEWYLAGCGNNGDQKSTMCEFSNIFSLGFYDEYNNQDLTTLHVVAIASSKMQKNLITYYNTYGLFPGGKMKAVEVWLHTADLNYEMCNFFGSYEYNPLLFNQSLRYGRINALKWCYKQHPKMVIKNIRWLNILHSEDFQVLKWYFELLEQAKKEGWTMDKPTPTVICVNRVFRMIAPKPMPIETFELLDSKKLIMPTKLFLLAHPKISLERAQTFPNWMHHGSDIATWLDEFTAVFWSFDKLKFSDFIMASKQWNPNTLSIYFGRLLIIGEHLTTLNIRDKYISNVNFEDWLEHVLATLGISKQSSDYKKFCNIWSKIHNPNLPTLIDYQLKITPVLTDDYYGHQMMKKLNALLSSEQISQYIDIK